MRQLLLFLAAAVTAATLFSSQAAAHYWRSNLLVPVEVAAACAARVGVGAPMYLEYVPVDGFKLVQVRPGFAVSVGEANVINACIANYAGFDVRRLSVVTVAAGPVYVIEFNQCPTGAFVGGDSYCIKRPWY